jgi:hypothetical protein
MGSSSFEAATCQVLLYFGRPEEVCSSKFSKGSDELWPCVPGFGGRADTLSGCTQKSRIGHLLTGHSPMAK